MKKYFMLAIIFLNNLANLSATMPPLDEKNWKNFRQLTDTITKYDSDGKPIQISNKILGISHYDPYTKIASSINPLLVLVDFEQKRISNASDVYAYFLDLLFTPNTKSMADYYKEISGNQFAVVNKHQAGTILITHIPQSLSQYAYPYPTIVEEICSYINTSGINFADFDANSDGIIDAVIIVHSGYPQEDSRYESFPDFEQNSIHSHKQNTNKALDNGYRIIDYVFLSVYSPLGTFCHEFGHILGLPDLYDTNSGNTTCNSWCLMDYGGWARANLGEDYGETPTHLSSWCKEYLGWATTQAITGNIQNININPTENIDDSSSTIESYKFDFPDKNEYFLLEYRDKNAGRYGAALPDSGFLFWHVNKNRIDAYLDDNKINYAEKYAINLLEADGQNATFQTGNLYRNQTDFIESPRTSDGEPTQIYLYDFLGTTFGLSTLNMTQNMIFKMIYSYPNPFFADRHQKITFKIITSRVLIDGDFAIYDVSGKQVFYKKLNISYNKSLSQNYIFVYDWEWDVKDSSGYEIGTGVYFAVLASKENLTRTKFAILR